jgi:hypothetical protein
MRHLRLVCLLMTFASAMLAAQSNSAAPINLDGRSNPKPVTPGLRGPGRLSGHGSTSGREGSARQFRKLNMPNTQFGFLAATQIPANSNYPGAGTYSPYPAVLGDFNGDKIPDVAAIVNNGSLSVPVYAISAILGNGDGTFKPAVLTTVLLSSYTDVFDPIFVGDVNGDGKDDIVILHQEAPATVEVWLSNGDGTFTETSQGTITVTSNFGLWATLTAYKPDTALDIVVADNANPGNIWVLKNNGSGTFGTPTAIPFTGQLNTSSTLDTGVVAFADFNNDGYLDFAGPAGPGSTASLNQMVVYLNNGAGGFIGPTVLATSDNVYDACLNVAGDLSGHTGANDIVSANCLDNNTVTVYANDGNGTFSEGVYYQGGIDTTAVTIADINGDGKNDIVSSNQQGADVTVLLGNGDGTMQPASVGYATGGTRMTASGVVLTPALVADFNSLNNDGHNDVIVPDGLYSFVYLQGVGDGTFRSAVDYYSEPTSAGNGYQTSVGIASGDFNGDGHPDFVVGNSYDFGQKEGNITVFISNGDGTLKPGVNYASKAFPTNFQLQFVAVGDFNRDGKLDIAATDAINGGVQIFTGNGDGTFTAGSAYPSDSGTYTTWGIIAGDFNGDGKTDLAVVNVTNGGAIGDVGVLINNGAGGFDPVVNYPTTTPTTEITTADVNGDKQLDLIVPLYGTSSTAGSAVAILLGQGNGTFKAAPNFNLVNGSIRYYNPYAAAIGDLNGDGKADIAVTIQDQTSSHNQGIAVALGNGDGTFQAPTLLASTLQSALFGLPGPSYVKIVDVNQDGHLDLLYTNSQFSTVGLKYGKGDGTFYDPVEYPAGSFAFDLAFADVNGDGEPDVVTSGQKKGFSGVTVLLNTGCCAQPAVTLTPPSLNFGNQTVGITSPQQVSTLTNTGYGPLTITSIAVTGTNSSDFAQSNNCGKSVPPNGSCSIKVTFTPTATGTRYAAVSITDNAANSPQMLLLSGVGVLPTVTFSPTRLMFPDQVIFTTSAAQPVTLTNTGLGILLISNIAVTGPFQQTNNCPASIGPGADCTISVKFHPGNKGVFHGGVSVTDNAPGSPQKVPLTGTGTFVQLTPAKLNFGTQPVGTRSLAKKITLTNKGDSVVKITDIVITGTDAGDFAETNTCGKSVASGASCFIKVTFKPLVKGKRTADVSVYDNGGGSPQEVGLTGTGT